MLAKSFLFSTSPYSDENLLSYIVRLTGLNRYEFPSIISMGSNLCFQHQWHPRLIHFNSLNIRQLCEMTGVPEEQMWTTAYPAVGPESGRKVKIFGHVISKHALTIRKPKFCPECLREKPYSRQIWDLAAYTTCAKHRVQLVDTCPRCQQAISWFRPLITRCSCGFDLTQCNSVSVEQTSMPAFELIHNLFYGLPSDDITPLNKLTFPKLLSLIDFMAAQTQVVRNTKEQYLAKQTLQNAHQLVISSYEIFQNWPINFHKFLSEYCTLEKNNWASRMQVTGIAKELGSFYKPFRKYKEPEYDFIRSEFESFVANWDGGVLKQGLNQRIDRSHYRSMDSIVDELGMSIERLKKFFDLGLLDGKALDRGSFTVYRIKKDSVVKLKTFLAERISVKETSLKLGIAIKLVENMVKNGMLEDAYKGTPLEDAMELSITVEGVDKLLHIIRAKIVPAPNGAELISFQKVIDRLHILRVGYIESIHEILTGKIVPRAHIDGTGLNRFFFDKADIETYMQQRKQELLGDTLTLKEVRAELQVGKIHAIRIWIKNGLLSGNPARKNGLPWWSIPRSEVEAFKEKYVFGARVAQQHGMVPQKLIKVLGEKGIRPVSGTTVDGSQVYVFLRSDVEAAGFDTKGCGSALSNELLKGPGS